MDGWNTSLLLGWPVFRGYVSFRECISAIMKTLNVESHDGIQLTWELWMITVLGGALKKGHHIDGDLKQLLVFGTWVNICITDFCILIHMYI